MASSRKPPAPGLSPNESRVEANRLIRAYAFKRSDDGGDASWLSRAELPTTAELGGTIHDGPATGDGGFLELPTNIIDGPWSSKEEYLRSHYELLREDAVAPLRDAIEEVREKPDMADSRTFCIYDKASEPRSRDSSC